MARRPMDLNLSSIGQLLEEIFRFGVDIVQDILDWVGFLVVEGFDGCLTVSSYNDV